MKRPSAIINITKRGNRRWASCPNCTAVSAPLAVGATQAKCRHCETEFDLKPPTPKKKKIACEDDPAKA
jgi:hypothetical protein